MKRLLSLILFVGSFAGAADGPVIKKQKNQAAEKTTPSPQSLLEICIRRISTMSLAEYLQSDQAKLPQELDALVAAEILKNNPLIMATLLKRINIPCMHTLQNYIGCIEPVAISPDNRLKITCSNNKNAEIWDIQSGQCLYILTVYNHDIRSVTFSPDGASMITGSQDQTAKIWNMSVFNAVYTFLTEHIATSQALLLKEWLNAQETMEQFDVQNPHVNMVFDSLPEEIKEIIVASNNAMQNEAAAPKNITAPINNSWYDHLLQTAKGVGAISLVGYGLYRYFKNTN